MAMLAPNLESVAQAGPQRVALVDRGRAWTYGEFWRDARRFAGFLRAQGLQPGDRVAIVLPNRIEAAVACYGTWIAGGAVVPLNAQARARDLGPWLAHSDARIVVGEGGSADIAQALATAGTAATHVLVGDGADEGITWEQALDHAEAAPVACAPDALATLLYTSGTTGKPKGVMLSHGNQAANTRSIVSYLELEPDDSIVSVLPFYYSYGASVLHTHLATGARIVLEENLVFPHLVVETIARERVTGFAGVPSTFLLLLNRVPLERHDLTALRYLTQAGGGMAPAVTQRLRAAIPNARLFVMYGQTEATARLTWLPPERLDEKLGSVGIPIPDVELAVRRPDGSDAATGEEGEVCVRGPNVMLGYWRDPETTRTVLRDGWLWTGDVGRLDADGFLFLSGRRSDMIKVGAHRVHPQDVEEAIAEFPGVAEVAVVGMDDELLGQTVQAFVVPADGIELSVDRLKAHCRARLAQYKIPKRIELTSALPRTASGKVRRVELAMRGQPQEPA
jgi:acyl-CoA synthetase (AMP-forming)/AMP-acid ligase II